MYWVELQDLLFLIKCLKEPPNNFNLLKNISFVNSDTRSATTNKLRVNYTELVTLVTSILTELSDFGIHFLY